MTNIISKLATLFSPPEPSFKNVAPNGAGWYQYERGKWRLLGKDKGARYLTEDQLWLFALEAIQALQNTLGAGK